MTQTAQEAKLNPIPVLVGLGIAYFITTRSMAFIPTMKEMDRKAENDE